MNPGMVAAERGDHGEAPQPGSMLYERIDRNAVREPDMGTATQHVSSARNGLRAAGTLLIAALWLFVGAAPAEDYPADSQIEWNSFDPELFDRAEDQNQPLFFYFHGQWCTWCIDFQNESLENPMVVDILNEEYIPVLIDLDRRADLFTRYGGRGLPFVVITTPDDDVISRFTGHIRADGLYRILERQQRVVSVTGREETPAEEPITTVGGFLEMLDQVYVADADRLSGSALFGTLSKRPQPWTYRFLLDQEEWTGRMPGLLDQVAEDLHDPVDGGFFFFYDFDQRDPDRALETSKRLDQNAAFLWLFARAWEETGDERYREIAEDVIRWLRDAMWDEDQRRFGNSQYADNAYYRLDPDERRATDPPRVDRTTYAHTSGQAIAALAASARIFDDDELFEWSDTALRGVDAYLGIPAGFLHAVTDEGQPELEGYLPAQIWPEIARLELRRAARALERDPTDTAAGEPDPQARLDRLQPFFNEDLNAHAERLGGELEPWTEVPTQAALAWWLHYLPAEAVAASHVDPAAVEAQLQIHPGADPDDIALGFDALQRGMPGED